MAPARPRRWHRQAERQRCGQIFRCHGPAGPGCLFVRRTLQRQQQLPSVDSSAPEPLIRCGCAADRDHSSKPNQVVLSSAPPPVLTDSAKLSSGYAPAGTMTFRLYAPDGTTVVDTETVPVSGNGTYSTPSGYTLPASGTVTGIYQWVASYSGDPNNNPASSNKGDEPVAVALASPTLSTTPNPKEVTLNAGVPPALKDSAKLAGTYRGTGHITFSLYAPGGTTVVDTETVPVSGNGTYSTPSGYTLPASGTVTGTYQWVATYSGDGNNKPAGSVKGDEPVKVAPASPTLRTTPNPTDVTLNAGALPVLTDSATLGGGYHATGNISFTLYAPDGTTVVDTETVTVSGNGTYTTPTGYTLPTSGTRDWNLPVGCQLQRRRQQQVC